MTQRSAPSWSITVRKLNAQKKGVSAGAQSDADVIDVSGLVRTFDFTDVEKGEDKANLTVDNYTYSLYDKPLFGHGKILEISWGYPEVWSPTREFVITKVTGGNPLKVEARGKAYLLMTERRVRTFEYMTHSDIARQIAKEYGFDQDHTFIDDTTETEAVFAQASMTDYQLLADLGRRNGFVHWIDFRGFHWGKRDLKQKPRRAFTYFVDRNGGDITGPPQVENDITSKPATYTSKGIDPKTKQPINATADNDKTPRPGLGPVLLITKTGAAGETYTPNAPNPVGSSVVKATSEKTQAAADVQAAGQYAKMQLSAAIVSFPAVGDPLMEAKTLITLTGFSQALAGNYYVTEVKHSLGSGYTMTVKCRRDGMGSIVNAPGVGDGKTSQASQNKQKADPAPAGGTEETLLLITKTGAASETITTFVPPGAAKPPK